MKKIFALLLAVAVSFESFATLPADGLTLVNGATVIVKLNEKWTSKSTDCPQFIVAANVTDSQGNFLINAGSRVNVTCTIKKAKGLGHGGKVDINFVSTAAIDGQNVPLFGHVSEQGENKYGLVHGLTWSLFFLVLGPLALPCLAIKGKQAEINSGYQTNINTASTIIVKR